MRVDAVRADPNQFHVFLSEVLITTGKFHQFRGGHGRKISRMRKEDHPVLFLPRTKAKILRQGRHGMKIWRILADLRKALGTQTFTPPLPNSSIHTPGPLYHPRGRASSSSNPASVSLKYFSVPNSSDKSSVRSSSRSSQAPQILHLQNSQNVIRHVIIQVGREVITHVIIEFRQIRVE